MKAVDRSPVRVLDVIDSCRTVEQLYSARSYAQLWLKRFGRDEGIVFSMYLVDKNSLLKLRDIRCESPK